MKKISWESIKQCDYCKGKTFVPYMKSSRPHWYEDKDFILKRCKKCTLVMANPRPKREDIYAAYVEASPLAHAAVKRKAERHNVMNVHARHVEAAMKHVPDAKRLFDMGCGAGTVMLAAREAGLEAEGNEINKASCEVLSEQGFTTYHGYTRDLDLPEAHYDIVINFDYLEHSYEPYADLKTCNRILSDGGILYLKTLYLDCPDHIMKGDGYQLLAAGHFSYFFSRILCSMIHSAGFEIIELKLGALVFVTAKKVREPDTVAINEYASPDHG